MEGIMVVGAGHDLATKCMISVCRFGCLVELLGATIVV
jgi:hypothetical protein